MKTVCEKCQFVECAYRADDMSTDSCTLFKVCPECDSPYISHKKSATFEGDNILGWEAWCECGYHWHVIHASEYACYFCGSLSVVEITDIEDHAHIKKSQLCGKCYDKKDC